MATSANITTTSGNTAALTFPAGITDLIIQNESDTAIRFRFDAKCSTTTTAGTVDTGILIPAAAGGSPGVFTRSWPNRTKRPLAIYAQHAGSGNKLLTAEAFSAI